MTDAVAGTCAEHDDAIARDAIGSSFGCAETHRTCAAWPTASPTSVSVGTWLLPGFSGLPPDGSPSASPAPLWAGGIALAARGRPGLRDAGRLPVDPDLPDEAAEQPTAPRHRGAR